MKYNGLQAIGLAFIIIGAVGHILSTSAFFVALYNNYPNLREISISTSLTSLAFLTLLFIGILSILWDMGIRMRFGKLYTWSLTILAVLIVFIPISSITMYFLYHSRERLLKVYASPLRNVILPLVLLLIGITILIISKRTCPEEYLT